MTEFSFLLNKPFNILFSYIQFLNTINPIACIGKLNLFMINPEPCHSEANREVSGKRREVLIKRKEKETPHMLSWAAFMALAA